MAYIDIPFETDFTELIDRALNRIRDQLPGWEPQEGHLEVAILEELTRLTIEARSVAAQVPGSVFSVYGEKIVGITQVTGESATATARFTMVDDAGYNIPGGTVVAWAVTGDERVFFRTDDTLTVETGSLTGDIGVTADTVGTHANGLGPGELIVVDRLSTVDSAELLDETSGGVDPETDEEYRDRLANELELQAPRPILPNDFAVLARRTAGVYRALALDQYHPGYNRLTENQASLETDTTGWNAGANTAITRDGNVGLKGSASLRLDDTTSDAAANDISAYTDGGTNGVAVRAGHDVTALASVLDNGTARDVSVTLDFYDDTGTLLTSTAGTAVTQDLGVWTQASVTVTAPSNTETARLRVTVVGVADGESHYVDAISLHERTHTDWRLGGGNGFGFARMNTLVPVDETGQPVSQTVRDALDADMEARREINFIVHTDWPVYTAVHVEATVHRHTDVLPDTAKERCEDAVKSFLTPANWGGGDLSPPEWKLADTVRYLELAALLDSVEGVDYVESLTINGAQQDFALNGVAPLPRAFDDANDPSTVTITVTP